MLGCGVRVSVRPAPGPRVNQRVVLYSVERRALQCTETSNEVKQNVQKERLGRRACRACLWAASSGFGRLSGVCVLWLRARRVSTVVRCFSPNGNALFEKGKARFVLALSLVSLINSLTSGKKLTVALKQKNTQLIMYALIRSVTHASTYIFKREEAHHRATRWRDGHAQMASTAIIAAPRQMATTFIVARGHDKGFFKPHRASEKVNSCGSVQSSISWLTISTPMCVSVPAGRRGTRG